MMSYWAFSDVFEEQGVVKKPFYGGFGILAERGIPKAAFNDFALLHGLGETRLDVKSDSVLLTRKKDGSLAIAAWNLVLPEETGTPRTITLRFKGIAAKQARMTIVDRDHGSPLPEYRKMGSPSSPTAAQIQALRKAASMPAAHEVAIENGEMTVTLPPDALAWIEIEK
jgi:xylan 1,4-beta-xylosidase